MYLLLIKNCLFFHSFYTTKTKEDLRRNFTYKNVFIPKLLNNPPGSCSLTNLDFLVLHTAHFDKTISFPSFSL